MTSWLDWRLWLRVWIGATAIGVLFAVQSWLTAWVQGYRWGGARIAMVQVFAWWGWVILAPIVFNVCRRSPIAPPRLRRAVLVHAGLALLMSPAHTALVTPPTAWLMGWPEPLVTQIIEVTAYRLVSDVIDYSLIVAGWHALVYYRELDSRMIAEAQLRQELAEVELRELRTQLQPHFVSNSLNAVAAYVREDPAVAEAMLVRLSNFFRSVLRASHEQRVPLEQEMHLLEEYLDIYRLRFGDRLQVSMRLDDAARHSLIPVMLLQPIVENALMHGVGTHAGPGHVHITVSCVGDSLRIDVADNGQASGAGPLRARGRGIGLSNTERRLTRLYGKQSYLAIKRIDGGTQVTLSFPREPVVSA
jgi:two-component system, LytTR family, sensor kinase